MDEKSCSHLIEGPAPAPLSQGCEACHKLGQTPVELRICRSCGHVGCCDSAAGQHATNHFLTIGHATMQSFEPGADWGWCYEHKQQLGPFPPAR
ncbi:MAG: hypothetical protein ACI9KN_002003 [Gammaproteobacteria bacterium]|jgi:hypothetical protein